MKLIQLRYLVAVAENDLNITQAARVLHAAQPGVSKQLKQLEDELGFQLFERKGRALVRTTDAGARVIDRAAQIVRQARSIKALASELRKDDPARVHCHHAYAGTLRVPPVPRSSATSTQGRRTCIGEFRKIADLAATDRIDFAIATA